MPDRVQMCGMAPFTRQKERDQELLSLISTDDLVAELRKRSAQASELAAEQPESLRRNLNMIAERGSPEWNEAWEGLRKVIVADGLGDGIDLLQRSKTFDGWQYMGTYDGKHEFRHRNHPITNCREYRAVTAGTSVDEPQTETV